MAGEPMSGDRQQLSETQETAALLGGQKVFRSPITGPFAVHDQLSAGLPTEALTQLILRVSLLKRPRMLEKALGISVRTVQRRKGQPSKHLSREQSGRAWKFAEILARATKVLGSQDDAEAWLDRPALGLDGRRPLDLLETPAGVELVEAYLGRMEYGVYT